MRVCHTVQSVQGDFICRVMFVQLNQNIVPWLGCPEKCIYDMYRVSIKYYPNLQGVCWVRVCE